MFSIAQTPASNFSPAFRFGASDAKTGQPFAPECIFVTRSQQIQYALGFELVRGATEMTRQFTRSAKVAPVATQAVMENDAGANKNKVAAFKPKAMAMRLLQDSITSWGVDTLWIYHTRQGLDSQARQVTSTSISAVELARLRRSLNMVLRVVAEGGKRGIVVDWARRGRSGITLWDESGHWRNMPERIESAVYDGLSQQEQDAIEKATPSSFSGPNAAIAWGFEQGCFRDAVHAANAYEEVKRGGPLGAQPQTAAMMWTLWIAEVQRRCRAVPGTALGREEQAA